MTYRNGFSPARPLWEARLGRTDADPGVRTLERGAGAEAARPAEASGVSSLGKAPRGGARTAVAADSSWTGGTETCVGALGSGRDRAATNAAPPPRRRPAAVIMARTMGRRGGRGGGSVPSVAASAARVDGTTAETGPSSTGPAGRCDGRMTTRAGGVPVGGRLSMGTWIVRVQKGPRASPRSRALAKRREGSVAMAVRTTWPKEPDTEGARCSRGIVFPA